MGEYLYYAIWSINIIFTLTKKKSKLVVFITIIFLGLVFCGNNGIKGDAYLYKLFLTNPSAGVNITEQGFKWLADFLRIVGINNYGICLVVIFIISLSFVLLSVRQITNNIHPLIATMMAFPFLLFATAIRFTLAFSISLYAITELATKNKKIKFLLLVLAASSFHIVMISNLLFLFVSSPQVRLKATYGKGKCVIIIVATVIIFYCLVVVSLGNRLPFMSSVIRLLIKIFPTQGFKIERYFSASTNLGFVALYFVYFVSLYVSLYLRKFVIRHSDAFNVEFVNLAEFAYYINVICFLFLPLYNLSLDFHRLLIMPTMLNSLVFSGIMKSYNNRRLLSRGARYVGKIEALEVISILSWVLPLILKINSISIGNIFDVNVLF